MPRHVHPSTWLQPLAGKYEERDMGTNLVRTGHSMAYVRQKTGAWLANPATRDPREFNSKRKAVLDAAIERLGLESEASEKHLKKLAKYLKGRDGLTQTQALDVLAKRLGYTSWAKAKGMFDRP